MTDEQIDRIVDGMYVPIGFDGHPSQFPTWCHEFAREVLAASYRLNRDPSREALMQAHFALSGLWDQKPGGGTNICGASRQCVLRAQDAMRAIEVVLAGSRKLPAKEGDPPC